MAPAAALRLKTYCFLFFMVIFGPLATLFSVGRMKGVGPLLSLAPADLFHFFVRTFASGLVWLGIGSLMAFFICYMFVLSWADFSYVQPASSIAYGIVALMGYFCWAKR